MIQKEQMPVKEVINNNEKVLKGNGALAKRKGAKASSRIAKFVVAPFIAGLFGFAAMLAIVAGTEFLSYFLHNYNQFSIDPNDVILSSLGFICFYLIAIIKNLHKD